MKFESKYKTFHSWHCFWKCCLGNHRHFVQGELSYSRPRNPKGHITAVGNWQIVWRLIDNDRLQLWNHYIFRNTRIDWCSSIPGHTILQLQTWQNMLQLDQNPTEACDLNSSCPGQNGHHFADIFKWISMYEKFCILIRVSLKFVPNDPIDSK